MPRPRLQLKDHLTHKELALRFRSCTDGRKRARWQALWLLSHPHQPRSADQAAELVGLTGATIRKLVHRYNAGGPPAVTRHGGGQGRAPRLAAAQQEQLKGELLGRAPDGGLWTGPKLARRIAQLTGTPMHPATGWEWLRKLGFTPQRPRPRNTQAASPKEQAVWKKKAGQPRGQIEGRRAGAAGRGLGGG